MIPRKPSSTNSSRRSRRYRFPQADTLRCWRPCSRCRSLKDSTTDAEPAETEAEDTRSVGGVDRRGSGEGSRVLCLGRSALGRSLHAWRCLPSSWSKCRRHGCWRVLTFRPEFTPPWGLTSHLTQLTLSRLGRQQVEAMVEQVTGGKALPAGSIAADCEQDRRGAVVCRRVDQDGGGVRGSYGQRKST